jgi:hypothetical protein
MFIKKYSDFILEKQSDENLMKQINAESKRDIGTCPRCGESFHDCICPDRDYYSTVNAHRTPAGKKIYKNK